MNNIFQKNIFNPQKHLFKTASSSALLSLVLTGCALDPIALGALTGSYDQAFELMAGTGNTVRTPDGKIKFTFAIHESATSYFDKNDVNGKENFRLHKLGSYLSKVTECSNGYDVTKINTPVSDVHAYEGVCK